MASTTVLASKIRFDSGRTLRYERDPDGSLWLRLYEDGRLLKERQVATDSEAFTRLLRWGKAN